jgi:hypothetical protein
MKKWQIVLVLSVYSFTLGGYLYYKGYEAGWYGYRHSKNMQYALKAAFQYGIWACEDAHGLTN